MCPATAVPHLLVKEGCQCDMAELFSGQVAIAGVQVGLMIPESNVISSYS